MRVRCGSPNKCDFCAYMTAIECGAQILIDALEDGPPRVAVTLTTRDPDTPMERFRRDVEKAVLAIRRRHPEAFYFARIEYTTGTAKRSGGRRRVHAHMLLKDVPAEECAALELVVRRVWKGRTGAHRIEVAPIRSAAGAMHYVTEHFSKAIQRPPRGWTGRATRYSIPRGERRGYFVHPLEERRERAREAVRNRRVVRRLRTRSPAPTSRPRSLARAGTFFSPRRSRRRRPARCRRSSSGSQSCRSTSAP